jgi:pantetheine-phosphate adenylyltransferase
MDDSLVKLIEKHARRLDEFGESLESLCNILLARKKLHRVVKYASDKISFSIDSLRELGLNNREVYATVDLLSNPSKYDVNEIPSLEVNNGTARVVGDIENLFNEYVREYENIFVKYYSIGYGGTFGPLHEGHKYILRKISNLAEVVYLGITSDDLARFKSPRVPPLIERKRQLEEYLKTIGDNFVVTVIYNPYGNAPTSKDMEAIVATPDTIGAVNEINRMRRLNNLPQLKVEFFDYLLAEDGKKISSSRIRRGEIDEHGNLKSPSF